MLNNKKGNFILTVLLAGGFIGSLSQSLLTSALPAIMKEFSISATVGQWLTTSYILVLGIITSTTAYLINKYDIKRLFFTALSLFLCGCIISIYASSFIILLLARVLQACGAGVLLPLAQVVALRIYPIEKHGKAMGLIGIVVGAAPAIGPTLSGLIVDYFGWRYIFIFLIIASVIVFFCAFFIKTNTGEKIGGKLEILSVILYGVGFCSLMLGVTYREIYGWFSYFTVIPVIIGIVCLWIFVVRQLKIDEPLLQIRILTNSRFAVSTVLIMVTYIAMMSGTLMVPIYVQSVMGLSAVTSGAVLFPGAALLTFFSPVTGFLFDKYGVRIITFLGMILLAVGTGAFSFFKIGTSLMLITIMYAVRLVGVSFLIMPLQAYGVSKLETKNLPHATAIINSLRQISGALGSSILVAIMSATSESSSAVDIRGINVSYAIQTTIIVIVFISTLHTIKNN